MKLVEIKLNNWCQYEGVHRLSLGDDKKRNVVLIHGDNDIGKSSIFYSIAWCFHETQPEKWKKENWPTHPILLYKKIKPGDEIHTSVTVVFDHENVRFSAERSFVTQKTADAPVVVNKEFIVMRKESSGSWVRDSEERLNRIFPRSVSGYFIFDAEKIEHFANQSQEVQDSVLRLLDIEQAQRAIDHLQTVSIELNREIKRHQSHRVSQLSEECARLGKDKEELKSELDTIEKDQKSFKKQKTQVEEELLKFSDIHELLRAEKDLKAQLSNNGESTTQSLKKLQDLARALYIPLAWPEIRRAFSQLDEKKRKGELPKGIRESFVLARVDIGECICGSSLAPGSLGLAKIREFKDSLSDSLNDIADKLWADLHALKDYMPSLHGRLRERLEDLQKLIETKEDLEKRLKDVSSRIQGRKDIPDVPGLQEKKERLENQIEHTIREHAKKEEQIRLKSDDLNRASEELKKEVKKKDYATETTRMWELADAARQTLEGSVETFKSKARGYLEDQCNRIGEELFWRMGEYRIKINEDYVLSVSAKDYGDINMLPGMSMGVTQITGLALIAALARQTRSQAPLIMDTPFARLSPAHITRALAECPNHFEQWVLFLQPSEWEDDQYRKVVASKIQKEFTLKRSGETKITAPTEGYNREFFGTNRG